MSVNFIRTLQNVNWQATIDKAVEMVAPHSVDLPDQPKHLVRNVTIVTHLEDYEHGEGLEIAFELQNQVIRVARVDGQPRRMFFRQFVAFIPKKDIVYLDEVNISKKTKKSIRQIIPEFLDKIYRKIPG